MKAFLLAIIVAGAGAYGAAWLLDREFQNTAANAFTTEGARVSEPGSNLVGDEWNGLPATNG